MENIQFGLADQKGDMEQILQLQRANLSANISDTERQQEGFVTAVHDLNLLAEMNHPYPHIVARHEGQIIGYTLVMLQKMSDRLPVLFSMFETIEQQSFQDKPLPAQRWFVMGQVCIAKDFRGQGLFLGLYQKLKEQMAPHFDMVITEVSINNPRSIRAHEKVGFKNIKEYATDDGEQWVILLWDWT